MKATLTFDLPEEMWDFRCSLDGPEMRKAIDDVLIDLDRRRDNDGTTVDIEDVERLIRECFEGLLGGM